MAQGRPQPIWDSFGRLSGGREPSRKPPRGGNRRPGGDGGLQSSVEACAVAGCFGGGPPVHGSLSAASVPGGSAEELQAGALEPQIMHRSCLSEQEGQSLKSR